MLTLFSKEKMTGNKKIIENLVLFLVLFIIVIVVINSLGKQSNKVVESSNISNQLFETNSNPKEETLEEKMESILSLIDGAGKVNVLITYSNGIEQVPMYDLKQNTTTTEEADNAGGTRKTEEISNEQNVIFNETGNAKTPVIKQTINPKVVGVIVIAEGASNANVKENLIRAVESSLDVASHRVQVFARKKV